MLNHKFNVSSNQDLRICRQLFDYVVKRYRDQLAHAEHDRLAWTLSLHDQCIFMYDEIIFEATVVTH